MEVRLKFIHLSLFIILLLESSCSHHSSYERRPSSLESCFQIFRSLWFSPAKFEQQNATLRSLHDNALELTENFYRTRRLEFHGLSPLERQVLELNLVEMKGVQRGEGVHYASHPIKLTNLSYKLLGNSIPEARQTSLYTMIHDVLEEGRGTTIDSLNWLRRKLTKNGDHSDIADAAYILVEPDIREIPLPEGVRYSMIEVVGYARQIEFFGLQREDRALFNASLIDKLFNAFDRYKSVIDGIVKEENFKENMQWRLAKQGYLLDKMKDHAHPDIVHYAQSLHENLKKELGITTAQVKSKIEQYKLLESEHSKQIDDIIEREAIKRDLL